MINPKITIDATMYFEISNSEMYGGINSVGYSSVKFGGIGDISSLDDAFVDRQNKRTADMLSVSENDVKLISEEEYTQATEEDESDEYDDEPVEYDDYGEDE